MQKQINPQNHLQTWKDLRSHLAFLNRFTTKYLFKKYYHHKSCFLKYLFAYQLTYIYFFNIFIELWHLLNFGVHYAEI